jgi:hypothetical protein
VDGLEPPRVKLHSTSLGKTYRILFMKPQNMMNVIYS